MPIPPAMMAAPGGGMTGATPPSPPTPPGPQAAPMSQPTQNKGNAMMGKAQVESAMQLLEHALAQLGTTTPEGGAVIRALSALARHFARPEAAELVPSQIMMQAQAARPSPLAQMLQHQPQGQPQPPQPPQ